MTYNVFGGTLNLALSIVKMFSFVPRPPPLFSGPQWTVDGRPCRLSYYFSLHTLPFPQTGHKRISGDSCGKAVDELQRKMKNRDE